MPRHAVWPARLTLISKTKYLRNLFKFHAPLRRKCMLNVKTNERQTSQRQNVWQTNESWSSVNSGQDESGNELGGGVLHCTSNPNTRTHTHTHASAFEIPLNVVALVAGKIISSDIFPGFSLTTELISLTTQTERTICCHYTHTHAQCYMYVYKYICSRP